MENHEVIDLVSSDDDDDDDENEMEVSEPHGKANSARRIFSPQLEEKQNSKKRAREQQTSLRKTTEKPEATEVNVDFQMNPNRSEQNPNGVSISPQRQKLVPRDGSIVEPNIAGTTPESDPSRGTSSHDETIGSFVRDVEFSPQFSLRVHEENELVHNEQTNKRTLQGDAKHLNKVQISFQHALLADDDTTTTQENSGDHHSNAFPLPNIDGLNETSSLSHGNEPNQAETSALPLQQIDPVTNRIIATFESIHQAKNITNINQGAIRKVLNGKQKTAGGYIWRRVDNEHETPRELSCPFVHTLLGEEASNESFNRPANALEDTEAGQDTYSADMSDELLFQSDHILNPLEMEVIWLGEESKHCMNRSEIDFEFVYEYASPSLRMELRKLDDNDSQEAKLKQLFRPDLVVQRRYPLVQEVVSEKLGAGYRRSSMALVVAQLRLQQRDERLKRFPPLKAASHSAPAN